MDDVVALVEVHSIGGLSGSPVFLHLPFWRDAPEGSWWVSKGRQASHGGDLWLLGVMHGFFPVGLNDPEGISAGIRDLNSGIAVVTRSDRLMDLVNAAKMVTARMQLKNFLESQQMPISSGSDSPAGFEEFIDFAKNLSAAPAAPRKDADEVDRGHQS